MQTERRGDWLDIYKFAVGSLMYCITRMREALDALGNTEAVAVADEAERVCKQARALEYDWEVQKQEDPFTRPEAKKLDDEIDSMLSSLMQAGEAFAATTPDSEQGRLAEEYLDGLFPTGVYHITSQTFEDQHLAVQELVERLNGPYTEHVEAMSLTHAVDRLEALNEEFGELLKETGRTVTYKEVQSARAEAHDAFHRLFIKVLHDYGDDLETLNEILTPVHTQTERTRRSLKRSGKMPEVDPETGEPVDEPHREQNDGGSSSEAEGEES